MDCQPGFEVARNLAGFAAQVQADRMHAPADDSVGAAASPAGAVEEVFHRLTHFLSARRLGSSEDISQP